MNETRSGITYCYIIRENVYITFSKSQHFILPVYKASHM